MIQCRQMASLSIDSMYWPQWISRELLFLAKNTEKKFFSAEESRKEKGRERGRESAVYTCTCAYCTDKLCTCRLLSQPERRPIPRQRQQLLIPSKVFTAVIADCTANWPSTPASSPLTKGRGNTCRTPDTAHVHIYTVADVSVHSTFYWLVYIPS